MPYNETRDLTVYPDGVHFHLANRVNPPSFHDGARSEPTRWQRW
jgi:hypothetical protein